MRRMSNLYDPYRPPSNVDYGGGPAAPPAGEAGISEAILIVMRQTKPWATFLGILGFVGCGFMILAGIFMMAAGAFAPSRGPVPPAVFGLFYIVFSGLYVYPSLCLVRYGSSISRFLANPDQDTLAMALGEQKSFWRFAGILAVVLMVLYGLAIVGGIAAAALMAGSSKF
jgi:hypothetical protein